MAKAPIAEEQTVQEQLATMNKIIADQNKTIDALKHKGIRSAKKPGEKPKRHWEIDMTTEQAAERELRRYIKNAGVMRKDLDGKLRRMPGGFRKNLSEEKKERAKKLMGILGREKLEWDESILDFRNHLPPIVGDEE